MRNKILQFFLVALIFSLIGYYAGVSKISYDWKNYKPNIKVVNQEPPTSVSTADFSLFWTVWQKIQNSYYDKKAIDSSKLVSGAIMGMVQSLEDPYTVFLPPVKNSDFKQGLAGQFQGIGAELGTSKEKQIIVISPLEGSPAILAGIRAGDTIFKVNGKSTDGWALSQAVEKIRGPKGTEVVLTVLHRDEKELTDIKIVRDNITIKSVDMWIKKVSEIDKIKLDKKYQNDGIAYIRLSQFGDNTNQEWLVLANKLSLKLNQEKIKGVILDLRNNPGGYLADATFIASEFIKSGPVVIQDEGNGNRTTFSVSRKGLLIDIPVVILINKGSASASEIVAGALHDYNRAKLIGETSFGKGTIQQAEDLGNGAGLHVTIAKWLTPKETWVHGVGLTPDIKVSLDVKDPSHDFQLEKAVEYLVK